MASGRSLKRSAVLLLDEGGHTLAGLARDLARECGLVEAAGDIGLANELISRCEFDHLVIEARPSDAATLTWIADITGGKQVGRVIVVADRADADVLSGMLRASAADLLVKPVNATKLMAAMRNGARAVAPRLRTARTGSRPSRRHTLVGESEGIRRVKILIERIAPSPATVLIEGETGTGKELVARLVHALSGRRGAFLPVNCAAIAPELMESELFGHTKGAFTSAHQVREGLFVAARGGTLFLDEISEMPLDMQVKLLRALEEGAIRPVGADRELPIDVRIVASTQEGLGDKVRTGRFREDLYYRLNVIHLALPPLRERAGDIPPLIDFFMTNLTAEFGLPRVELTAAELADLKSRPWPGNVRELRNVIERTVLLGTLPAAGMIETDTPPEQGEGYYPIDWTLEQVKQHHMQRVVADCGGNKSAAARRLGVSRKTLDRKFGTNGR